jgi:hypothetical protein
MDKSKQLAEALIKDYSNSAIRDKIEEAKKDGWKNPDAFWVKILTNQMHVGSNSIVLKKRMNTNEFKVASNFQDFLKLDKKEQKELLDKFVPGGRNVSKEEKIKRLTAAIDLILSKGGIKLTFASKMTKKEVIDMLTSIKGIGAKQARNIPMDLYHPAFRNGSIPIDENWRKIAKHLGFKWSNSEKHEQDIIEWRNKYIGRDTIKDDWDFDRLIYWALNEKSSNVRKILK